MFAGSIEGRMKSIQGPVKLKVMDVEPIEGHLRLEEMAAGSIEGRMKLIEGPVRSKVMTIELIEGHMKLEKMVAGSIEGHVRSKEMAAVSTEGHVDNIVVGSDRKVVTFTNAAAMSLLIFSVY